MAMTQLELPYPARTTTTMSDTQKKPRFTLKVKKEAKAALLAQIREQGWDPPDAIWRLIDSLNFDILKADAKKE